MEKLFNSFASKTARAVGSPLAFLLCVASVLAWAATGPMFKFSETWQLVINTGTTIVTFLMVFLIQNTQNRDGSAIQAKLDELIRTSKAKNEFMGIETLTDSELEVIHEKGARGAVSRRRTSGKTTTKRTRRTRQAKTGGDAKATPRSKSKPGG